VRFAHELISRELLKPEANAVVQDHFERKKDAA
jgi:hypothetical protein